MRHPDISFLSRTLLKSLFILIDLVLLIVLTTQTVTDGLSGQLGMQSGPTDNAQVEPAEFTRTRTTS